MTEILIPFTVVIALAVVPYVIGHAILPGFRLQSVQWLLGLFLTGIYWLICYVLSVPKPITEYIYVGITVICLFIAIMNRARIVFRKPRTEEYILYATLGLILLFSLSDIYANPIIAWDGVAIWLAKTKDFYYWSPFQTLTFVHYPGLGSMIWSVVMTVFGFHESLGRFMYPFVYAVFFSLLWSMFYIKNKTILYTLTVAIIATVFVQPSLYTGYQDDFLSLTTGIAAVLFCGSIMNAKRTDLFMLGCFFSGSLALIKNEGIVLGLILLASYYAITGRQMKRTWKGIVLFVLLLTFWSGAQILHGIDPRNIQGDQITLRGILGSYNNISRLPIILPYVFRYVIDSAMTLAAAAISIAVGLVIPHFRKIVIFMWIFLLLHAVSVIWIYLATTAPLVWHLDTSFSRLMDQHASLYIVLCIVSVVAVLSGKRKPEVQI